MKIERASEILGWMSLEELRWLAERASKSTRILEVGSFLGRSTRALADNAAGRVYAIDTWRNADAHPFMRVPRIRLEEDWAWQGFLRNVKDLIPSKIEVRRRNSLAAAKEFSDEGKRFDLIFIDGAHDYESVKADIEAWSLLLAEGGLLCGHDFCGKHPGVLAAVRELVPTRKIVDTIWFAA